MFQSYWQIFITFTVLFTMEIVLESKMHLKSKLIKKFGSTRYVIFAFITAIFLSIMLAVIKSDILENKLFQAISMGIWFFSVIGVKYTKRYEGE